MKKSLLIIALCSYGVLPAQVGGTTGPEQSGTFLSGNTGLMGVAAPFELVSFVAEPRNGEGVSLHWSTANEPPGCRYVVERSADRLNWFPAFTQEGEGIARGYNAYEVMDLVPLAGLSYYRLIAHRQGNELSRSDDFATAYAPLPDLQFRNETATGGFRVLGQGAISNLQVLNNRGQFMPMELQYDGDQVLVHAPGLEPGTYFVQADVGGRPVLRTVLVTPSGVIGG